MIDDSQSQPRIHTMESGDAMTVRQIAKICRRRFTPIIFMSGEISSGKTTLIASLHDAFLFGPLAGFRFAGSQTLVAFEERCFESRAKSEGVEPQTPRTRYGNGQQYFHLAVQGVDDVDARTRDILFADMSGEFYERSLRSSSEARQLQDLKRAQYLLVLLDGAKLKNSGTRQAVRANALSFLRRCMEEAVLTKQTTIQVLISKWDEVTMLPESAQDDVLAFVTSRINEQALGRQVSVTPIASRPGLGRPDEKLFGVRNLFPGWLEALPQSLRPMEYASSSNAATSSFSLFPGIGVRR
jgi:Double-GTPase 2